jgi:hypothetical protein
VVRLRFVRGNTCCDKYCAKVRASRDFDYGGVKTPPFRCEAGFVVARDDFVSGV